MTAGLGANLGEGLGLGAVFLHVRHAGATEVTDCHRDFRLAYQLVTDLVEGLERRGPVVEVATQRAGFHLLETERQYTFGGTALDRLPGKKECRRAGRAVVVDIDDRDAGHAYRVKRALSAGRVAIYVAHICLLHLTVVDARVGQRAAHGIGTHLEIGCGTARLCKRHHADTTDDGMTDQGCVSFKNDKNCK